MTSAQIVFYHSHDNVTLTRTLSCGRKRVAPELNLDKGLQIISEVTQDTKLFIKTRKKVQKSKN